MLLARELYSSSIGDPLRGTAAIPRGALPSTTSLGTGAGAGCAGEGAVGQQ